MANGKVVKYRKVFKVIIEGTTDTAYPDEPLFQLETAVVPLKAIVKMLDDKYVTRSVTMKEVKK